MRRPTRWLVALVGLLLVTHGGEAAVRESRPAEPAPVPSASRGPGVAKLPLLFVENAGQTDECVALYAKTPAGTAYLTRDGITWGIVAGGRRWALKLDFVGARKDAAPVGEKPAPAVVSYLKGPKAAWHAGIRSWTSARATELWPGIDVVHETKDCGLKYSFEVEAGADPSVVRFDVRGADELLVDANGRLVATTPLGRYIDDRPVAWQDTPSGRRDIAVSFDVDDRRVGFRVGAYDASLPLVIDPPTTVYAAAFGGAGADFAGGIAVDAAGNAYVTGRTVSDETTFPVTAGLDPTFNGGDFSGFDDAFVAKINPAGDGFVYVTYLGGTRRDWGTDIEVDATGAAYVCGLTASKDDFPTLVGPDLTHGGGFDDGFVVKLNPAGTALVYGGFIGGVTDPFGLDEVANGLALDDTGRAYVVGTTAAATGFPTAGGLDATPNGGSDVFVAVVTADGSAFEQAGFLGGAGNEVGNGIALGPNDSIYVCGRTTAASFPAVVGPSLTYGGGTEDAIVAKFDAAGALQWAGFWGGAAVDIAMAIDVDADGNAWLAGYTNSREDNGFPVVNATDGTANGSFDACVARVKADGTGFDVSTFLGGAGSDLATGVVVREVGLAAKRGSQKNGGSAFRALVTVCGTCDSEGLFPTTSGSTGLGGDDMFVTQFGECPDCGTPASLRSSTLFGTPGDDRCEDVSIDPDCTGCVAVCGDTFSADLSGLTSLCGPCDLAPGIVVAKLDSGTVGGGGDTRWLSIDKAAVDFDLRKPIDSEVGAIGSFDLGRNGFDATRSVTAAVNGRAVTLEPTSRKESKGSTTAVHKLSTQSVSVTLETVQKSGSSKVSYKFSYTGDLTGLVTAGGELSLEFSQDVGACGTVKFEKGCLRRSKVACPGRRGIGAVLEPRVAPVSLVARRKGAGRDRFVGNFRLAGDGTTPAVAPAVHVEIGTGLALDVAGEEFVRKRGTFVFTGPIPGAGGAGASATVKLDYAKKLMTVDAKGVTVVDDPDVSTAVRIVIGVGSDVRSFEPTLRSLLTKLVY